MPFTHAHSLTPRRPTEVRTLRLEAVFWLNNYKCSSVSSRCTSSISEQTAADIFRADYDHISRQSYESIKKASFLVASMCFLECNVASDHIVSRSSEHLLVIAVNDNRFSGNLSDKKRPVSSTGVSWRVGASSKRRLLQSWHTNRRHCWKVWKLSK